ncbi:glycosyltransferase [Candidatus Nitrosocosmicus arcticus]|uniref:Putative UDP-glucuronosyltransferase n=1 Tax=Candidatus Nitrosocosmicus arcticus TaxID=2035267 RepID=A0A557SSC1_9ARCH|nr:glycosyltransferase [Candidatus Nitrosocosmicus arcticus]TVP39485.1 putative UDP-glucuronosyltransferase [Candidatus Nitrosocosmicus arcticus]
MTLFFSSPIGLGHITRDIAIAMEIGKSFNYYDFDFITGSKAFDFICNENDSSPVSKFNTHNLYFPPDFSIDDGKLSNSFVWLLKYVSYFRKSKIKVKKLLSTRDKNLGIPSLIITDEDFASLSVGKDLNIPRILITDILRTHFIRNGLLSNIEKFLNNSMCSLIKSSDCVIIPESGDNRNNFFYVGPIVREIKATRDELRKRFSFNKTTILITTGGTSAGHYLIKRTIESFLRLRKRFDCDLVVSFPSNISLNYQGDKSYRNIGFVNNIHEYVYAADLVISLAGKSTIDESLVYGTPGIFIPIKNHFEQEDRAKEMGFSYEDINKLDIIMEENLSDSRLKKERKASNGAAMAAALISKYLNK